MCRNSAMKVEHSGEEVPHVAIRLFGATIPIASADRKPSLKRSAEFQNADEPSQRRQKSFRPDPETEKPSQVRLVADALNFWKTEKAEGSMISLNHGSAAVGFTNPFNSEEIILSERESLESKLKNTESSFSPLDKEGILGFSLKSLLERKSAVASFSDSLKSDDEVRLSLNTPPPEHEASESKSFTTTSLSSDEMKLSLNASELSCSQTSRRNAAVTLKSETATATPTLPPVHESVESRPLTGKRAAYQRKTDRAAAATSGSKAASSDKPQMQCPRCESSDTKFCYYNNYNVNQPRYFCKNCRRYWTAGGTMRNIPVGAGRRKSKHFQSSSSSNTSEPEQQQQIHTIRKSIKSDAATHESTPPLAAPCFEGLNSSGILNSFMAAAAAQGMSSSSSSSALFKEANSRAAAAAAAAATASPWLFPCPPNFLANSSLIYGKPLAPENAVNGNHVVISQGL